MDQRVPDNIDVSYPCVAAQSGSVSHPNHGSVLSVGVNDKLLIFWGAVVYQKVGTQLAEFTVIPKATTILFVNRGKLDVTINGEPFCASPGQALVILENETCVGTGPHETELSCQWLTFGVERRRGPGKGDSVKLPRITDVGDPSIVMELFRLLTEEFHKYQSTLSVGSPLCTQAAQFLLLSLLSRMRPAESDALPASNALTALAERARDYMRANADKSCTIADVARHLECSDGYLRTAFRLTYGYSPGSFLLRIRMHRARYLLGRSRISIDQVARECGYNDPSYFARVFSRENGTTPSRYRSSHSRQYVTQGI